MYINGQWFIEYNSGKANGLTIAKGRLSLTEVAQLVAWRHGFNDLDLDQHADGKNAVVLKAYGPNRSLTVKGPNTEHVVAKLLERLEG